MTREPPRHAAPQHAADDTAAHKTGSVLTQTIPFLGDAGFELQLIRAFLDPETQARVRAEAAALDRAHRAQQNAMDRYMDSRNSARDDGQSEWVLDRDPLSASTDAPIFRVGPEQETTMTAQDQIRETIEKNDVVLFMKGTKMMPQCGFSSRVAGVLNFMGVEFQDVNVLADPEIRQGIKAFSDWPTIPQLYVKGEFVGGCDIVTEMTLSGELDQLLEAKGVAFDKAAADKIREANA
jgi:monothiol glutaredoxin